MPEETNEPTVDQLPDDAPIDQVRAALKREKDRRKAAEAEAGQAAALQREVAFLKAGVDASTPLGGLFVKGYDGELDVDAIKAAYGQIVPQQPPVTPQDTGQPAVLQPPPDGGGLTEEQLERLRQSQGSLTNDSSPPGSEPTTPLGQDIMNAAFEATGARTRPQRGMDDKALNAGFSRLFERANQDDPEAIFKRPSETWGDATERWRRQHS